jgi:hypothetical protein
MPPMRAILVAVSLIAATPALAQHDVENTRRTIAAIEEVHKHRPNDPALHF